jgi:hypothetical protein
MKPCRIKYFKNLKDPPYLFLRLGVGDLGSRKKCFLTLGAILAILSAKILVSVRAQ